MSNISLSVLLLLFCASKRNRLAHSTAMHLRVSSQNRSKKSNNPSQSNY